MISSRKPCAAGRAPLVQGHMPMVLRPGVRGAQLVTRFFRERDDRSPPTPPLTGDANLERAWKDQLANRVGPNLLPSDSEKPFTDGATVPTPVPPQPVIQSQLPSPPPAPTSTSATSDATSDAPAPQPPSFGWRRLLVFAGLIVGYSGYYLTRNSLTYTAPVMVADKSLGFTLQQIGVMTSIFPIAYGMSKFVSGILGDRYSPTLLLGGGLIATAAVCIAFGASSALPVFCALWALNGLLQGVGAPSCARMLTAWFASKERGTWWGMWNMAHNLGGFIAPIVAATAASALGWRWGMWAPGIAGLVLGTFVLAACRDTPQQAGFNAVEPALAANPKGKKSQDKNAFSKAMDNVLKNPAIWALALTYFFIYVVRQGITSWGVFYLMKEKGVADAGQAAARVTGLELGGLVGSLVAGGLSDMLIRNANNDKSAGTVGKRVQVVLGYTAGLAAALLAFQALPASAPALLQWLSVAAIGFFIYGPQMMIGLCGAELVNPDSVGASQGVLGWVAYLGAANAGVPLSMIVERFGWGAYFSTLVGACGAAALLLLPMLRLRSYTQRQEEMAAKTA